MDVSAGFVGLFSYIPFVHGLLIAVHTFGAKMLVLLHTVIVVLSHDFNLIRFVEHLSFFYISFVKFCYNALQSRAFVSLLLRI